MMDYSNFVFLYEPTSVSEETMRHYVGLCV